MIRRLCLVLLALLLAGCGGEAGGDGSARLWVTRDRGQEVVLTAEVPAGISALEAVRREAEVETRYGGRFIQAINGIEGDIAERHDWFWFVNGYEGDRSAADYELHDGDLVWWDHRSWEGRMRQPVVVGAFPEPFLHGWDGKRRPAMVIYYGRDDATLAERLAEQVNAVGVADREVAAPLHPEGANVLRIVDGDEFSARVYGGPGGQVVFEVGDRVARRLAADPGFARFRYAIP